MGCCLESGETKDYEIKNVQEKNEFYLTGSLIHNENKINKDIDNYIKMDIEVSKTSKKNDYNVKDINENEENEFRLLQDSENFCKSSAAAVNKNHKLKNDLIIDLTTQDNPNRESYYRNKYSSDEMKIREETRKKVINKLVSKQDEQEESQDKGNSKRLLKDKIELAEKHFN